MIPIKLLRNNQALLAFIEDTPFLDHDDFLEGRVAQGSEDARALLAIENASEIAKRIIQGHYEDIMNGRGKSVYLDRLPPPSGEEEEYIHVEATLEGAEGGGHAIMLRVHHAKKRVYVYDSMGEDAYVNDFEEKIRSRYPGYRIIDKSLGFQPTGGFTQATPEQMAEAMYITGEPRYLERAWEVSQYDELSQHHFCYVEAFIVMLTGTNRNGPDDPRDRLRYIKKVVWGLIHTFYTGPRDGPVWDYFTEYFPYYMSTWNSDGSRMRMRNDIFQIPRKDTFVTRIERFETVDTTGWSVQNILAWAAKT